MLPLDTNKILEFISFLDLNNFASASITTYITAISFVHKMANVHDPTAKFCVQKVLCAVNKLHGREDSRLPITLILLSSLNLSLSSAIRNTYHRILLQAMFSTAFFGLCRIGEITQQPDGMISLFSNQITVHNDYLLLTINHFKHHKSRRPIVLKIYKQSDISICPVLAMLNYLDVRPENEGPLFCFPDGKPMSEFFHQEFKILHYILWA